MLNRKPLCRLVWLLQLFALASWGCLAVPSQPSIKANAEAKTEAHKHVPNNAPFPPRFDPFTWKDEDWIALFTVLTGFVFFFQLRAMWRENLHFRVTERAYVKLSHFAPGVYWEMPKKRDVLYAKDKELEYWMKLTLQVKNLGHTPANVERICVAGKIVAKDGKLPAKPDYADGKITEIHAHLVTEDDLQHPVRTKIARDDVDALWGGEKRLYIIAYAEYRDKFGKRHRASYARQYDPTQDPGRPITLQDGQRWDDESLKTVNNLPFIEQSGYNADITQRWNGSWPET